MNVVQCLPMCAAQNLVLQSITSFYAMTITTNKALKIPQPEKEARQGPGVVTLAARVCRARTRLVLWEAESGRAVVR